MITESLGHGSSSVHDTCNITFIMRPVLEKTLSIKSLRILDPRLNACDSSMVKALIKASLVFNIYPDFLIFVLNRFRLS